MEDEQTEVPGDLPVSGSGKRHRVRRVITALLVILGCVLAPVSVVALWAKTTVLDTDNYVAAVAPLATNQDIREAVATRITDRIMSESDVVSQLEGKLPARITSRLPNLQAAAEAYVHEAALRFVSSPKFAQLWEDANRRVQAQVVAALTGNTGKLKLANNGTVTLDLSGVSKEVRARLEARGVSLQRVPPGTVDTSIVLFRWPWLGTVQDGVDLLQQLAWVLPFLTLLCFAGAIALSVHRRRTVVRVGLGLSAGMLVVLVALAVGRGPYLDLFATPEGRQAGGAAYDQLLHGLRVQSRAIFVLGLVIAFGAWLVGRSPARADRSAAVRGGVIALGFFALAAFDKLTAVSVLAVAGGVIVVLVLVEWLNRRHERRSDVVPDEISPGTAAGGGTRPA
jgi:hypothetical protein